MSLTDHLRNGQQCDEDGVMCIVSRQACHEAADEIERLRPLAEAWVKHLETAYENSKDDGAFYHDWQDALKQLNGA